MTVAVAMKRATQNSSSKEKLRKTNRKKAVVQSGLVVKKGSRQEQKLILESLKEMDSASKLYTIEELFG